MKDLDEITEKIIGAAITVHKELGPGLLESVYLKCMAIELKSMGLKVDTEVPVGITYRGNNITDDGYRLDLLVEDRVIVELKSVDVIQDIHKKQLLTYLKLTRKPLGLLINFNEKLLKNGITRILNGFNH